MTTDLELTPPPETELFEYIFTAEDMKDLMSEALEGKARQWREEILLEDRKGAADRGKMGALGWGANQLDELALIIRQIPEGEVRERPVTPPPPPPEAAEFTRKEEPVEPAYSLPQTAEYHESSTFPNDL